MGILISLYTVNFLRKYVIEVYTEKFLEAGHSNNANIYNANDF